MNIFKFGFVAAALSLSANAVSAQVSERYVPSVWVDPDGCEHWVMDDGAEGFMSLKLGENGLPVCHNTNACLVASADRTFSSDSAVISAERRQRLVEFFNADRSRAYIIEGHTDSLASDAYNNSLSLRRANAVAEIARSLGANIQEVRGLGERSPITSNATAQGRSQNRRVEIICVE